MSAHPLPPIPAGSVWATANAKESEMTFRTAAEKSSPDWKEAFAVSSEHPTDRPSMYKLICAVGDVLCSFALARPH